jgi:hypothetical protein
MDKEFTRQRLDETGLYYYRARYYDAELGSQRGAIAPLKEKLPLPLDKGKGIKGIGLQL